MNDKPKCSVCGEPLIAREMPPRGAPPNGSWAFVCERSDACRDKDDGGTHGPNMTLAEATASCLRSQAQRTVHTFEIEEPDRQAIVLALSKLTFTRPGWRRYMRTIADGLSGADMFDEFVEQGPDVKLDIERVVQRLDPEGEAKKPIRFQFQVNGVIALWAKKHDLPIGLEEINELIAFLTLDPRAIVPLHGLKAETPGD